MGCCESSLFERTHHSQRDYQDTHLPPHHEPPSSSSSLPDPTTNGASNFIEFSFLDLKAATNNFSSDNIVSESGEKAPNIVYKGCLNNRQWVAVKKFTKTAWPDPEQFVVLCFLFSRLLILV